MRAKAKQTQLPAIFSKTKQETNMKKLTLRIKRDYFNAILSGQKAVETREVKPTNATRLVYFTCDGKDYRRQQDVPDSGKPVYVTPVHYDSLLLINGYRKNAPRLLVEVKSAEFIIVADENGNDLTYERDGEEYLCSIVEYRLGRVLNKENV